MTGSAPIFDEVDAYERFMGRWSRAAAAQFLRWLRPPPQARWLDVGCGTGILSRIALGISAPAAVVGIDPTPAQVAHAAHHVADARARFEVADARALPFPDRSFDVAASALVLNFIPEPDQAVLEMARVVRRGGIVAAYVWDFELELSPSGPLRKALAMMGFDVPPLPGSEGSNLQALAALFGQAGLAGIATTAIEVLVAFADFQDFWDSQTTRYSPTTKIVAALGRTDRQTLVEILRTLVSVRDDGVVEYAARANAVKAHATTTRV